jgi:hypothetical protein
MDAWDFLMFFFFMKWSKYQHYISISFPFIRNDYFTLMLDFPIHFFLKLWEKKNNINDIKCSYNYTEPSRQIIQKLLNK